MVRFSQIGASRNPFRSSSTAEYSAVVFVAIFAADLSSSNLKFARFLHCACSAGRLTFSTLNGLRPAPTVTIDTPVVRGCGRLSQIGARLPGVDTERA